MNGEYGAEDPMDNEAVFRNADDLSGFDRTQAWESACEQMNQLGIEEGNLQYKGKLLYAYRRFRGADAKIIKGWQFICTGCKKKKAGQRTRRVIYSIFLRLYRESKFSGMKISRIIRECMVICRCM